MTPMWGRMRWGIGTGWGFEDLHLSIKGFVSGTEFFEPGNKDWGFSGRFRHGFCIFGYLYLFFANLEGLKGLMGLILLLTI